MIRLLITFAALAGLVIAWTLAADYVQRQEAPMINSRPLDAFLRVLGYNPGDVDNLHYDADTATVTVTYVDRGELHTHRHHIDYTPAPLLDKGDDDT